MNIELAAFDGDFDWLRAMERVSFAAADQMSREELVDFARDRANRIWQIEESGHRIGALLLTATDDTTMYLESMALDPAHRAAGRGERTLKLLAEKITAEGFRIVQLHVRVSNPSRRLYERLGFRMCEEVLSFYADGETAWRMEWNLLPHAGR